MMELSADGNLLIDAGMRINARLRFGPWEAGLPVERWTGDGWSSEYLDPPIPLLSMARRAGANTPVHRFVDSIPQKVRERADPYRYRQTALLQWVARRRAVADLLQRSPTLLWLLVATAAEQHWERRRVDLLLCRPRVYILNKLTRIRSEAAVKFLDRLTLLNGDYDELRLIRLFLLRKQTFCRQFGHWETIPVHILAVLLRFPALEGAGFLRQLADENHSHFADAMRHVEPSVMVWEDALRMAGLLNIRNGAQILARCRTFDAVQRLHDRWVERLNRQPGFVAVGRRSFPAPPIPGNDVIQPLRSEKELMEEGRLMGHCVASYAGEVRFGRRYIYRVLSPERATLEIQWRGGAPVVAQFNLARNREPSEKSWRAVHNWLAECNEG